MANGGLERNVAKLGPVNVELAGFLKRPVKFPCNNLVYDLQCFKKKVPYNLPSVYLNAYKDWCLRVFMHSMRGRLTLWINSHVIVESKNKDKQKLFIYRQTLDYRHYFTYELSKLPRCPEYLYYKLFKSEVLRAAFFQ